MDPGKQGLGTGVWVVRGNHWQGSAARTWTARNQAQSSRHCQHGLICEAGKDSLETGFVSTLVPVSGPGQCWAGHQESSGRPRECCVRPSQLQKQEKDKSKNRTTYCLPSHGDSPRGTSPCLIAKPRPQRQGSSLWAAAGAWGMVGSTGHGGH